MKKLLLSVFAIMMGGIMALAPLVASVPAFAKTCAGVETSILECSDDDGNGNGIKHILNLVVEIMTIGVGIFGTIGIVISGIQYLTAGGNEEQTRKAKRRIFEIVIGLFAYVLIYAVLYFLLPDFKPFSG